MTGLTQTGSRQTGATQASALEVEELLRCLRAVAANDNAAPQAKRRFNGRPLVAALLAVFVFAPGCAAAAVFLLRNDNAVPPLVTPDSNPPLVAKSDRLPLEQWSAEAAERLAPQENIRFAAAVIAEDTGFLNSLSIRGSVEDTLTVIAEPAVMEANAAMEEPAIAPRPRFKRHARRPAPIKMAEAVEPPPAPPEPGFFEKLFGQRFN